MVCMADGLAEEPAVTQTEKMASPNYLQGLLRQHLDEMNILCRKIGSHGQANGKTARRTKRLKHLGQTCVPHVVSVLNSRHRDVRLDSDLLQQLKEAGADLLV